MDRARGLGGPVPEPVAVATTSAVGVRALAPRGPSQTGLGEYTTREGKGVYAYADPDTGELSRGVEVLVRGKWGDASFEDVVRKQRYLEQDLVDNHGRKTFVSGANREITRSRTISDYDTAMSLDMPDSVRSEILRREGEFLEQSRARGMSEADAQAALESQRTMILRDELSHYDLDHKVDLQLGGRDRFDNLNWLKKDVNRSFGSQLKWRSRILGVSDRATGAVGDEFSAISVRKIR